MEINTEGSRIKEGEFLCGQSGAGKSELAFVFSGKLSEESIKSVILQQDDYFVYPPKTNAEMRKENIGHVGVSEVRLDLLDQNLQDILEGKRKIEKPLVDYEENCINREIIDLDGVSAIIVEGTYTTLLKNVHKRIFIDRTYQDTLAARQERARENQDEYLERILQIEDRIISSHKSRADVVVTRNYRVEAK